MVSLPRQLIGKFKLGTRWIELYVEKRTCSGSVRFVPDNKGPAQMTIGMDGTWAGTLGVLIHETMEAALLDLQCQYVGYPQFCDASDNRWFMFDHAKFGEACDRAGWFLHEAVPALSAAYTKANKLTKRK